MLYIKTFFASIAIHIVQSVFFSALLWGAKWVFSLLSIGKTPGWKEFIWGSAGIFLLLFLCTTYKFIKTLYHCKKEPMFRQMHIETGISWEEYQALRRKRYAK